MAGLTGASVSLATGLTGMAAGAGAGAATAGLAGVVAAGAGLAGVVGAGFVAAGAGLAGAGLGSAAWPACVRQAAMMNKHDATGSPTARLELRVLLRCISESPIRDLTNFPAPNANPNELSIN